VGEEKLEVEILSVRPIVTYPKLGEKAVTHIVTYVYGDLAPRSIWIPEAEDIPEERAKRIREDIKAATEFKPEKMTV